MATSKSTILALPNEILDRIFSYLAWTPDVSLTPSCPDITNISLSCRFLREAVIPTLFRNVRLKLRWTDGAVAEPGLYRLRREAPGISKLIRCVHVQTEFGQSAAWQLKPFTIPLALEDWNTTSDEPSSSLESKHRKHIQDIAAELYGPAVSGVSAMQNPCATDYLARAFFGTGEGGIDDESIQDSNIGPKQASLGEHASEYPRREESGSAPADGALTSKKQDARKKRLQLDALITCMVSLPPRTQSLILEAVPIDQHDKLQHAFALQFCAMALRLFADRLQSVTMISRSLDAGRRGLPSDASSPHEDYDTVLSPAISALRSTTQLTLASTNGVSDRLSKHSLDAIRASQWQVEPLCSNVTQLSLRNITDKRNGLFDLIKGFSSLSDLTIDGVKMGADFGAGFVRPQHRGPENPLWLLFLISIRLHRPGLRLHLGSLCQWHQPETLPRSAVRWLMEEAVPVGANVDFERETRLTEDFGSFITLWLTDDSDLGSMAREDKGIGKLVDDAFSSRWKTFANLR